MDSFTKIQNYNTRRNATISKWRGIFSSWFWSNLNFSDLIADLFVFIFKNIGTSMNISAVLMLLMRCNRLFVFIFPWPLGIAPEVRKKLKTKSICSNVPKSGHKDASSFSYWCVSANLIILRFGKMAHLTQFYRIFA